MAATSLSYPAPQCEAPASDSRCPNPATWYLRAEHPRADVVGFFCTVHALEQIATAMARGFALHAKPVLP